jgi:hypothetical protein
VAESVKLVMVPGARALACYELGHLAAAADAARAADAGAQRLGFSQHFFAVDHLRALSGLALERRDLNAAERFTEHVLSITEQRRPLFEFLALLDPGADLVGLRAGPRRAVHHRRRPQGRVRG